jgi:hypothetical protein
MKFRLRRNIRLLLAAGAIAFSGCPSPAAPPGPPAEIPSSLRLPDPRIDLSEVAAPPTSSLMTALVGSGGSLSDEIAIAPNRIGDANISFGIIFDSLKDLEIPVGTDVTRFVSSAVFTAGPESETLELKLDFADFNGEGCSGHTASLPICLRMWAGGAPFLAAVFDQFPTEGTPGSGRLKIVVNARIPGGDPGVRIAFDYDHSDPLNKRTESLLFTPETSFAKTFRRAQISQVGPEGLSKKSIHYSDQFFFDPSNPDSVRYIGSFLQDPDPLQVFWSGSLELSENLETPALSEISDVCAQVATGNEVLAGTCRDLGIDTTGFEFIDFATEVDFALFDFPESPTF